MNENISSKPYILTQDTKAAFNTLNKGIYSKAIPESIEKQTDIYFDNLANTIKSSFPESLNIEVKQFYEKNIDQELNNFVSNKLTTNQNTVCLCLDRFLLDSVEKSFSDRFLRISINRSISGEKTSRQGNPPLKEQFVSAAKFIKDKKVIIADDGVFSGGTIKYILDNLIAQGVNQDQISQIVGFIGDNETSKINDIPVKIIAPIENLFEWVDIRDFSIIGGKQFSSSKNNGVTSAIPYIFPWSDGSGASFNRLGSFFDISKKMILSFSNLVSKYQSSTNKSLTVRDLLKAGFPMPTNQDKTIPITLNTSVNDYLSFCLKRIDQEQQREVIIFDMDGTLYQLDGVNNSYKGSSLETNVLTNSKQFILSQESCSDEMANQILQTGLSDPIGLSQYLSERYSITRKECFDATWNINPETIINNYQPALQTINQLAKTNKKLILLTSAPSVWQKQVCNYLGITNNFESIFTGEDFKQKTDIFSMLSERYLPKNITSVGDQLETDILPAINLGFRALQVTNLNFLFNLI